MSIHRQPARLAWFLVGAMLLSPALPAIGQTKTRKKPVEEASATPASRKRPRPKATPEPASETAPTPARPSITEARPKLSQTPDKTTYSVANPSAANASISPDELVEFHAQPSGVRKLIEFSLDLTRQNLTYTFGSADPASGGMDCSGFIYHVLRQYGLTQVPRDSSGQYVWVRQARTFRAVISRKPDSFEMDELLPGDLVFWVGTYATDHDPPISHVMIYLGTEKAGGSKVMVGSSDGRAYRGQKRNGVSVFDFTMPRTPAGGDQRSTFIGYARIPGLRE